MNNNYFGFDPNLIRSVPYTNIANAALNTAPRSGLLNGLLGGRAITTATGASKITFSGILNGASKTLGVINQAIPVFYQIKPVFNNAKTMYRVAKEINRTNSEQKTNYKTKKKNIIETKKKENNNPTFFL